MKEVSDCNKEIFYFLSIYEISVNNNFNNNINNNFILIPLNSISE